MFLIIFMKRRISNKKPQSNDQAHAVIGVNNYIDLPVTEKTSNNRIPSRHRLSVTPNER